MGTSFVYLVLESLPKSAVLLPDGEGTMTGGGNFYAMNRGEVFYYCGGATIGRVFLQNT